MATTKKTRSLLNVIMVVLAVVVVAAGVAFVVLVRGGSQQSSPFTVSNKVGYANIERAGISYALEEGTTLQEGDAVETLNGSEVTVKVADGASLNLADASRMKVNANTSAQSGMGLEIMNGCVFADGNGSGNPVAFEGSGNKWAVEDAVVVSDVRSGTLTVQVLSGNVKLSDGTAVQEGESYTIIAKKDNDASSSGSEKGASASSQAGAANASSGPMKLSISALDSFALQHALDTTKAGRKLVFTESQINEELERRENERQQLARQAAEESTRPSSSESAGAPTSQSATHEAAETKENAAEQTAGENSGTSSDAVDQGEATYPPDADTTTSESEKPETPKNDAVHTCTIQIRCDALLDNMDNLAQGKSKYVPKNGVLLRSTSMTFEEGESAFDVLNRACKENGIALEYSYVPIYGSYYVEGIGNLYEFDCGDESGWMYKVNGWFPNYGCSQYELSDGDAIVFCYTCKGLGEDVGA